MSRKIEKALAILAPLAVEAKAVVDSGAIGAHADQMRRNLLFAQALEAVALALRDYLEDKAAKPSVSPAKGNAPQSGK